MTRSLRVTMAASAVCLQNIGARCVILRPVEGKVFVLKEVCRSVRCMQGTYRRPWTLAADYSHVNTNYHRSNAFGVRKIRGKGSYCRKQMPFERPG